MFTQRTNRGRPSRHKDYFGQRSFSSLMGKGAIQDIYTPWMPLARGNGGCGLAMGDLARIILEEGCSVPPMGKLDSDDYKILAYYTTRRMCQKKFNSISHSRWVLSSHCNHCSLASLGLSCPCCTSIMKFVSKVLPKLSVICKLVIINVFGNVGKTLLHLQCVYRCGQNDWYPSEVIEIHYIIKLIDL